MKIESLKPQVSCFTCTVGDKSCEYVECDEIPDEFHDKYHEYERPSKCGKYNPIPVVKCRCCSKPLEGFWYSWKYWYEADECGYALCKDCFDNVPEEELKSNLVCMC